MRRLKEALERQDLLKFFYQVTYEEKSLRGLTRRLIGYQMDFAPNLFYFFFLLSCLSLHSAQEPDQHHSQCPSSFTCGAFGNVGFPFSNKSDPDSRLPILNCSDERNPKVQFAKHGRWYHVVHMNYSNEEIVIHDQDLQDQLNSNSCDSLNNFTLPISPSVSFNIASPTLLFFKCKREILQAVLPRFFVSLPNYRCCNDYDLYFIGYNATHLPTLPKNFYNYCSTIQLPVTKWDSSKPVDNLDFLWSAKCNISWDFRPACVKCWNEGGQCIDTNEGTFKCGGGGGGRSGKGGGASGNGGAGGSKKANRRPLRIGIGVTGAVVGILLVFIIFFILQRRKKVRSTSSTLLSRNISSEPSSKPDIENMSTQFLTPIFKYDELEEATENFHSSKELGDGGFGTVYYGKLHDGREVAVKRLYEHNYKRVEQFMNEINILSRLRHKHLVSLYGCTSRDSRELLLVYEFVPNGTVADHLHGQRARSGLVTWPVRMSIAIESADALAYLHATDIIHRDVKTNNILLDNNFQVKVADFGLSRLFPTDVTHVSTAPQGTPGYVDPEYYQCYQLNDKSDVYSFGVVLIELISSKPAVDISRHRHEINLASMAINKILNHALHELVDPSLGFETDYAVRRMISLVAELAFRCLQQEKEMRPSMKEVLESLKKIESETYNIDKGEEFDVTAEVRLLKGIPPFSPDSVTEKWGSIATTPNTSG